MNPPVSHILSEFLKETDPYTAEADTLSAEAAEDLYSLLASAARVANAHTDEIDTELRVSLCDRMDRVTDRLSEYPPPHEV